MHVKPTTLLASWFTVCCCSTLANVAEAQSRAQIALGPSDGLALDQPRVAVEFTDAEGASLGPDLANSFLLDTGSERILIASSGLSELVANGYQTDGQFVEQGISGFTTFEVSKPYGLGFVGTGGQVVRLQEVRAISLASANFGSFAGIIGMPGMVGLVASLDFTRFANADIFNAFLGVELSPDLPPGAGHRYSVPLEIIEFPLPEPDPPTTSNGIPFMTVIVHAPTRKRKGRFVFDTGAQVSILSEHMAFLLGLDSDGDGNFDNEAVGSTQIGGIGGALTVPILDIGDIALPTAEGTDLIWGSVQVIIVEIHPEIDGVFGSDLLTSGWIEAFLGGDDGYLQMAHCDFREAAEHRGTLAIDVTDFRDTPAPGLPPMDSDGDHIEDDWECLFFEDLTSPLGDIDHDGLPLLLEHALCSDPTLHDPSPLTIVRNSDGTIALQFPRNRHLPFAELVVEQSPSLEAGSWTRTKAISTTAVLFDALTELVTLTVATAPGELYYRLHAAGL